MRLAWLSLHHDHWLLADELTPGAPGKDFGTTYDSDIFICLDALEQKLRAEPSQAQCQGFRFSLWLNQQLWHQYLCVVVARGTACWNRTSVPMPQLLLWTFETPTFLLEHNAWIAAVVKHLFDHVNIYKAKKSEGLQKENIATFLIQVL